MDLSLIFIAELEDESKTCGKDVCFG